jgi:hypothetical protein
MRVDQGRNKRLLSKRPQGFFKTPFQICKTQLPGQPPAMGRQQISAVIRTATDPAAAGTAGLSQMRGFHGIGTSGSGSKEKSPQIPKDIRLEQKNTGQRRGTGFHGPRALYPRSLEGKNKIFSKAGRAGRLAGELEEPINA